MKPVFDENGLATTPGNIRCFYYDAVTGEHTGWSDEYIHIGVSMPGSSTDIDPGDKIPGKVLVFTGSGWEQQEDHRGETVYSVENKQESVVDYIGPVRDGFTGTAPSSPFDKWDGEKWVKDEEAEKAAHIREAEGTRAGLMQKATDIIAPLQDAIDLDMATDAEKAQLLAWKKYRVLLNRVDTSKAPDINWPVPPEA